MSAPSVDPVLLSQDLIRRPSVTPDDAGAMDLVENALERLGFACRRMRFGEIENLYARRGSQAPNLCFAGHTDVVPVGDAGAWRVDPFAGRIEDGVLIGRGATDMKSAIAAFIAAAEGAIAAERGDRLAVAADHWRRGGCRHPWHPRGRRGPASAR